MQELNRAKKDAFAGKMVGVLNGAMLVLMTSIGRQTGLLETMAHLLPSTSEGIAQVDMTLVPLPGYSAFLWSDLISDRTQEISAVLLEFLGRIDKSLHLPAVNIPERKGELDGILYRIEGTGPPLVLFPLGLAPSQWEPLVPVLKDRYCTIRLGGAELGFAAILEARGRAPGYLDIVRSLIDDVRLQPGQTVLDVGCGTGILTRWLVTQTGGESGYGRGHQQLLAAGSDGPGRERRAGNRI